MRKYAIISLITLCVFLSLSGISWAEGTLETVDGDNSYVDNGMEIIGGNGAITIITDNSGTITIETGQTDPDTGDTIVEKAAMQVGFLYKSDLWISAIKVPNPYPTSMGCVIGIGNLKYNVTIPPAPNVYTLSAFDPYIGLPYGAEVSVSWYIDRTVLPIYTHLEKQ